MHVSLLHPVALLNLAHPSRVSVGFRIHFPIRLFLAVTKPEATAASWGRGFVAVYELNCVVLCHL